jgi:hypothetical protein
MSQNPDYLSPEGEERSSEIAESSPSTLSIITQSEHAAMVATANMEKNRRNLDVFSKKLMAYATHSQPVALSMFYTLPRAGKQIIGASVRFAEVVAPCWRNNSTGSRMIGMTDNAVTAQGVFIDYEANMRNVKEIPRKITDKQGNKFNDDMILTTSKAALSIAYREAILKGGVPMALWSPAYEQAKLTAVGQAKSHSERIDSAMEYLTKLGVTEWQILNTVGCTSPKEMEIEHLTTLKVLCEEIKKGERTIEEVFGSPYDKEIDAIFTQLGKNETEKRLLRQSYMGRPKELLEYLRERLAPAGKGTTVGAEQTQTTSTPPAQTTEAGNGTQDTPSAQQANGNGEAHSKRRAGRPSREDVAAREAAAKEQAAQTQSTPEPETEKTEAPMMDMSKLKLF